MPYDRDGRFWKPPCGVNRCSGRGCYEYSKHYECCFIVVQHRIEERALRRFLKAHIKAPTLGTIANRTHSLPWKQWNPLQKSTAAEAHAEQAKPLYLATILNYDGEKRR